MVPIHFTANSVFTTIHMQIARYQPVGKATEERSSAVSDIFLSNVLPQSARARSECARRSA